MNWPNPHCLCGDSSGRFRCRCWRCCYFRNYFYHPPELSRPVFRRNPLRCLPNRCVGRNRKSPTSDPTRTSTSAGCCTAQSVGRTSHIHHALIATQSAIRQDSPAAKCCSHRLPTSRKWSNPATSSASSACSPRAGPCRRAQSAAQSSPPIPPETFKFNKRMQNLVSESE